MELKAFAADLSSPGTQGKHCMHFYIAALYLQRNGKSITGAEGERRGEWRRIVHVESDLRRIPLLQMRSSVSRGSLAFTDVSDYVGG